MRKTIIIATLILLGFASCGQKNKVIHVDSLVYYTVKERDVNFNYVDGDVEFMMTQKDFNEAGLTDEVFKNICSTALVYADWAAKNKMSYKLYSEKKTGYRALVASNGDGVFIFIDGSAENAYGVRGKISTFIPFNNNFEINVDGITGLEM